MSAQDEPGYECKAGEANRISRRAHYFVSRVEMNWRLDAGRLRRRWCNGASKGATSMEQVSGYCVGDTRWKCDYVLFGTFVVK